MHAKQCVKETVRRAMGRKHAKRKHTPSSKSPKQKQETLKATEPHYLLVRHGGWPMVERAQLENVSHTLHLLTLPLAGFNEAYNT
jgi:hypothetical protein